MNYFTWCVRRGLVVCIGIGLHSCSNSNEVNNRMLDNIISSDLTIDNTVGLNKRISISSINNINSILVDKQDSPKSLEKVKIFGVESENDELKLLLKLNESKIMTIDSLVVENKKLKWARVEFAGVEWGVNPGFLFFTSRHDTNSICDRISEFYEVSYVDGEDEEEPRYKEYFWNRYHLVCLSEGDPYIRLRSVRGGGDGMVMMWDFDN